MKATFSNDRFGINYRGRLLEGLRHVPVVAVAAAHEYVITVDVQLVRTKTIAGRSTRRPIVSLGTREEKPTSVVIGQHREEEVITNHTIGRLAILRRKSVFTERSAQIFTIGICLL